MSEIMVSGKFLPLHEDGLLAVASAPPPEEDTVVERLEADEARMRIAYLAVMDEMRIDVLAIPTATYPPKRNGDRDFSIVTPHWDESSRARGLSTLPTRRTMKVTRPPRVFETWRRPAVSAAQSG